MDPCLRPVCPADLDSLAALMRAFYEEDGTSFDESAARAAVRILLEDPARGRVFLLEEGAQAFGYVVVTFGFSLEFHGRDAFVDELFLLPQRRGRGLGREALRLAERVCREHGARALHLEVRRANLAAQRLYRGAGFEDREHYLMTKRIR